MKLNELNIATFGLPYITETFIFTFIEFSGDIGFIDDNLQNGLKNRTPSSLVMFLCFFGSKLTLVSGKLPFFLSVSSAYIFKVSTFSLQKRLSYFAKHTLEKMLQIQNRLLPTCS